MEKKKNCPCCGSKEIFPAYHFAERYVYCEECGLRTKTYKTLQLAIKAWNTRALNNEVIRGLERIILLVSSIIAFRKPLTQDVVKKLDSIIKKVKSILDSNIGS